MKELVLSVGKGIKSLFREKINYVIAGIFIIIVMHGFLIKLSLAIYLEVMNRIDHIYLKGATTTEEVHHVKINKDFDGRIESNLTEAEKLDLIKNRLEAQSKVKQKNGLRKYLKELRKTAK